MADITLGPFVLEQRIGKGGMGEVWRARHATQAIPVAVKVMTAAGSSRPMFVESFKNEVRAVAALSHPHIATVLDYGTVSREASLASSGRLVARTPYLSMELVDGTTLADHMGKMKWTLVERVLKGLLDALAHAHARDVIHRDLKLSNVLYDHHKIDFKLTDFGIAHAMAATGDPFRWGTPAYMPPEQLLGRWWDYGPWTDLYSLGCCAFALVTGERPFTDETSSAAASRRLPPLHPRFPVPEAFADWLNTLCDPDPAARYQVAADAAWTFDGMCASFESEESEPVPPEDSDQIVLEETSTTLQFTTRTDLRVLRMPVPGQGPRVQPPLPANWQRNRAVRRSEHLLGAGLALFGMRRIPTVGRTEERDALWRALGEVKASNSPRVVVLAGPAGCGKTRLGEWLLERAHEVGAASVMRASHHRPSGPADGIAGMLARFLRTGGLGREPIEDRVAAALRQPNGDRGDAVDVAQIVQLLAPKDGSARAVVRPGDRHAVIRRFVARQARNRAVVMFVDDVQYGIDTLEFVQSLVEQRAGPVLVVLAARDEALVESPVERTVLEDIARRRTSYRMSIGPLPELEHRELVQHLIGLDAGLAKIVEERTAGNPMFAIQLVGDWVQKGVLVESPRGWELAPGAEITLPDDLYATWAARIDDLLVGRPEADRDALEVAAILGQRIEPEAWWSVCEDLGATPSPDLVEALLAQHLASADDAGAAGEWMFVHSMLRESLERRAEEAGRSAAHHGACARYLWRSERAEPEPLARHLIGAGDLEGALLPLIDAIDARCTAGEFDRADQLLTEWEDLVRQVSLPDEDERWMRGLRAATQVHRYRDRREEMLATCARLERGVKAYGWPPEFLAYARAQQARSARMNGEFDQALLLYRECNELLQSEDGPRDPEMLVSLLARIGHVLADVGSFGGAEKEFRRAEQLSRELSDVIGIGEGQIGRARVALEQGDLDRATRFAAAARESFRAASYRFGLAETWEVFGGIARQRLSDVGRQNLDEASRCFRTAAAQWRALGTDGAAVNADLLAAMVQIELGAGAHAISEIERCGEKARVIGDLPLLLRSKVALAAAIAPTADEASYDRLLVEILDVCKRAISYMSVDIAVMAEIAGRACVERGWTELGRTTYDLAVQHWSGLQREEDRERVLVTLDRLD